ncbi:MAG TPA: galactokinase [Anaerolineae bacterium]|nr:galactokinase [Anaerolineae bacterium]
MSIYGTLERIYGDAAEVQQARYAAALESFARTYGPGPVHIFRAPGRVNLIGEHTDYNHGFVLPVALDRDVLLLARPRSDPVVHLRNAEPEFAPHTSTTGPDIPPAPRGDWSNYVRGAAQMVARQVGARVRGMDALVAGAPPYGTPRGAGVSSSSALTVVAALALARLNGWQSDPIPFARMCSEAEWYVGTRGGIMDQFIALLARPGHALFLDCRPQGPDQYTFAHVPLPSETHILVADTGVHHANVRGEFNLRVAACRAGVACLRPCYPGITHLRDVQDVDWTELSPLLPEALTVAEARAQGADLDDVPLPADDAVLRVRACCRHVHSENERVRVTVAALEAATQGAGDVTAAGRLLDEAHASARDDYDVSCPELEALVEAARAVEGTAGARLTGAGWGGCIVALVHRDAVSDFEARVSRRYREAIGREPRIFACRAGGGAEQIDGP